MRKEFIEPCVWITHMFVCISSSPDFHGAERERDCRLDFWGGSTEAHCTVGLPLSLMTFPPAAPSPPFSIAWQCHLPPTQSLCTGVSLGPECPHIPTAASEQSSTPPLSLEAPSRASSLTFLAAVFCSHNPALFLPEELRSSLLPTTR